MWKSRSSPGLKRLFEANTKTPEAGWSLLLRGQEEHRGREGVEAVRGQEGYWRPRHLRPAGAYSIEAKTKRNMEAMEEWKQSRAKKVIGS